ncbi:MAG: DNA-3-methyladenine glycosylase I [Propionibacteriaceae bacterium]|nr:DNA-3-methyladenine glycosylase I [Propionibacteriaceae bacterium]
MKETRMDMVRCFGANDPLYQAYHDEEWGRRLEVSDDEHELLERVCLEGFQAGLSWLTVLRKREAFREAFTGFRPDIVAEYDDDDVEDLMLNPEIIRNRMKIVATIGNAQALLQMHADGERLADLIGQHAPPPRRAAPLTAFDVPSSTPESEALSKELHRRGFRFVGPTTMYALMQAIGMVDDHIKGCWLARAR